MANSVTGETKSTLREIMQRGNNFNEIEFVNLPFRLKEFETQKANKPNTTIRKFRLKTCCMFFKRIKLKFDTSKPCNFPCSGLIRLSLPQIWC